jgi:Protein of unknown function (DUF3102)
MQNTSQTKLTETELNAFAEKVKELHSSIQTDNELAIKHGKLALAKAIECGKILVEVHSNIGYGKWGKWIKSVGLSISTERRYRQLCSHVNEVKQCESLREAYLVIGEVKPSTIKEEPAKEDETCPTADNNTSQPKELSPQKMKETDAAQYKAAFDAARNKCSASVLEMIGAEKRLDWNLSMWTIKNNKPCSGDETNFASQVFHSLKEWIAKREYTSLTIEDEVMTKAGLVLAEVVKTFIHANQPNLSRLKNVEASLNTPEQALALTE